MKILKKIQKIISKILEIVLFVFLAAMLTVTFSQVIARFIIGKAIFWAEEAAILCMVWLTFLGSAVAMERGAHTRIDFLINLLPVKLKRAMEILDYLVIAVFTGVMAKYSLPIIQSTGKMLTTGLKIPRSVLFYSVFAGAVMIMLYCIIMAIQEIIVIFAGEEAEVE